MANFHMSDRLKKNYDKYYEGESEWRRLGAISKSNNIIALCNDYPHATILEIGAGEGSILKRLSDLEFGESLYAMEISKSGVETIKKKEIRSLTECIFFNGYDIPYKDNKFDLAILSHVLEHVEYPRKLLYEAKRVANLIFIEVPLEDTLRLSRDFVFDEVGHINCYSPKTIRRLIQTCGLVVLNQIVTNYSKQVYEYRFGKKGLFKYLVKELMLRTVPNIAPYISGYHSALICRK